MAVAADKGLRSQSSSPTETRIIIMLRTQAHAASAANVRLHLGSAAKACGHTAHVGTCAACQRAQLAKWNAQLAQVAR
jgi:hypothetical protein